MPRLIFAILAAILINGILATAIDHVFHATGVYPPYGQAYFDTDLYLLALAYRFVITVFAAYVTAMIAKEQAKRALGISGVLGAILWVVGTLAMRERGPLWYGIVGAVTAIPLVLFGGKLYERRMKSLVETSNP